MTMKLPNESKIGNDSNMPIRPHLRRLYPADWPRLTNLIRFERAKGRCETCGRPHGRLVLHCGDGRWFDKTEDLWKTGHGIGTDKPRGHRRLRLTKVILATAHLDHDPTNNDLDNLKALCQRCHLLYDQPEHRRRRWLTLRSRKALGDLFLGPYSSSSHPEGGDQPRPI